MSRRRSFRKPDPALEKGVAKALQQSFEAVEQEADAEMNRLIGLMKNFEGSGDA